MVLGFFSFSKFLMYRDLDPENWPVDGSLDLHPSIQSLLQDGFEAPDPIVADDGKIDPINLPVAMNHVIDTDSSPNRSNRGSRARSPPGDQGTAGHWQIPNDHKHHRRCCRAGKNSFVRG
ncbi:hypothetical protein [Bradyrhizobium sp. 33ap4]|uniref:hypothetical protein n=1 Tax=Bradyrhizobium sp. 33ap4 TaxID=3061630 RepID=UPI0029314DF6|nr:hypothetical protein [Bradyrhizobium sp. 33ap4]